MPCSGPRYFPAAISRIRPLRLGQRSILRQRDDAPQLRIELFDAAQIDLRESLRGDRFLLDPARQPASPAQMRFRHPRPEELSTRPHSGRRGLARGAGAPTRAGFHCVAGAMDGSIATLRGPTRRSRNGAIDRGQLAAAMSRSAGAHGDLRELFRLRECRRGHRRAGHRASPERRRRSRGSGRRSSFRSLPIVATGDRSSGDRAHRSRDEKLPSRIHGRGLERPPFVPSTGYPFHNHSSACGSVCCFTPRSQWPALRAKTN